MKFNLVLVLSFHLYLIAFSHVQNGYRQRNASLLLKVATSSKVLPPGSGLTAVDNLLKDREPIASVLLTPVCRTETTKHPLVNRAGDITQYLATSSCQVSNHADNDDIVCLHDNSETQDIVIRGPPTDLRFRAMYLEQLPNKVTYMILDPAKARWFFTARLSGCDIFIATKTSQPNMPLVVHANADVLQNAENQMKNLHWKGLVVDQMLKKDKPDYTLRVRLHIAPEQPLPDGYTQYLADYDAEHPDVTRMTYDITAPMQQWYYFIGFLTDRWRFFYKGDASGIITDVNI